MPMRGGQGIAPRDPAAASSVFNRHRSTLDGTIPAARVYTGAQQHQFHEVGHVTSERVARLCGDHLEHCYEAQRLSTHGTTCISVAYHTAAPGQAGVSAHAAVHGAAGNEAAGDQQLLVCATNVNSIAVFNAAAPACVAQHTKGPKRLSCAFTASLSHVAVYGDPMAPAIELQLCNLNKFAFLEGHTAEVRCVDLTPSGSTIISGGRSGQVFVWQVQHSQQQQQQQANLSGLNNDVQVLRHEVQGHAPSAQVKCCCLSADGRWAATGGSDGKVLLWDLSALSDPDVAAALSTTAAPTTGPVSPRATNSCCRPAPAGLVQLAAEWQLGPQGREQVSCLTLAADGSVLAVGTRTGKVYVVPTCCSSISRQLLQLPTRHSDGHKVRCAALSPDAQMLVTTADDARMILWDLTTLSCMLSIHEHTKPIRGCCWSPDGKHICSVGDDNLLCIHDIVILSASSTGSKLRMATRLDGRAGLTAAAAAADTEAEGAGESFHSSSTVLKHPCLKRMDVSMLRERLLACVPLPGGARRSSCGDSAPRKHAEESASGEDPATTSAATELVMQDGVLCAEQSGQLLLLPPDCTAAVPTGMSIGSSIACCCFDDGVVAAAKRDGAVTAMSCMPGTGATGTPTSGASASAAAGLNPGLLDPSVAAAAAAAAAAASAGGAAPQATAAAWGASTAVSAKMDMLVLGISVCRRLGRVALAGVERKNTQTGIVYLWEFDPSCRPPTLKAQGTLRGLSTAFTMLPQLSNKSLMSSRESADGSVASPNWASIDFDLPGHGKGAAAGADGHARWSNSKDSPDSPSAAAAKRRSSHHGLMRLSSSGDAPPAAGFAAGPPAASTGPSGSGLSIRHGWLWHSDNPVKVLSCQEAPVLCSAWTKGPELPKLVVGSAAGWLVVINCEGEDMEESMSRYQIHRCEVSAVDCASDGTTVVSGSSDGRIVLWSHVTGFKLAVFTVHKAAIRSLAFNTDGTLLAAGDTDGIVSAWDVPQSCLLSAAKVHEGYVSSCCWSSNSSNSLYTSAGDSSTSTSSTNAGSKDLRVISCSYDGTLSILQVNPKLYRMYCAAFCGLYHTCKKNNKLHKLEVVLKWHLQQGALQDASVLQVLVVQAAADGNAAVLGLLLPMFDTKGWLLHFGPIFARPTLAGPPGIIFRKTESNSSLLGSSKHDLRHKQSTENAPHAATATDLQPYQPNLVASTAAVVAVGNGIGLGLEDYVIHPHDRAKVPSSQRANGAQSPSARRSTADRFLGSERVYKRTGSYGDSPDRSAGFLEGSIISTPRNSRWASSVADIKTMLAFTSGPQAASAAGAGRAASPLVAVMSAAGRSSFNSSSGQQVVSETGGGTSDAGSITLAAMQRSASGSIESDASWGMYTLMPCPDSPRSGTSPSMTPTRLLSPSVSRNARGTAQLPMLDTLHEESYSRALSTEEKSPAGSSRRSTPSLAAAAAARPPSLTPDNFPDNSSNSPRHPLIIPLSPSFDPADASDGATDVAAYRGIESAPCTPPGYSPSASPSPNAFVNHLLRSARGSQQQQQQQQEGSPSDGAPVLHPGSPLQRQGSGSLLPPWSYQQQQQQQPHRTQEEPRQRSQRDSMARQVAALVSNRWLTMRWTSQDRGENCSTSTATVSNEQHSAPLPILGATPHAYTATGFEAGCNQSAESSPGAVVSVTAAAAAAAADAHAFAAAMSAVDHTDPSGLQADPAGLQLPFSSDPGIQPPSKQNSAKAFMQRLASSISRLSSRAATSDSVLESGVIHAAAVAGGLDVNQVQSAFSAASGHSRFDGLAASKRKLLASWTSWRDSGKSGTRLRQPAPQLLQRPPIARKRLSGAATQHADLLQVAMATQQAQCVRLVVDALLEGRFSKVSIVLHMYEALQALIHDPQHKRTCRRLLKNLPLIDNGEVEVDSMLVHNTKIIYKCSLQGHTGNLWSDAVSSHEALLDALDVLVKHSSWQDSIVALLIWPVLWFLRYIGASWLWLWRRQGLRLRHRVQVSATSKLVPVAHAAEIRPGSRGNLLRQLLSANVDADLYGKELVRAVINVKWESFARAFLLMQFVQFSAFLILFLAYMSVAVYGNDPAWTTSELVAYPQGRAALALECILMIMMFGQAADEAKQMVTYKQDYFNSPWNYFDCASIIIICMLFVLHITRLNHQLFIILMALELLLLCLRALYFCMAAEKVGALLRMVLIVIKDMRHFFLMLAFLLVCFGLTFSVLMSPATTSKLNLVSLVGTAPGTDGAVASSELQVFGSLEDSILQLFTIMFGDMQFSTLKTILSVNTVASRLAVFMAAIYAVLVLIVLVNLLIAIVDETYGVVKESEADQILRNKALIIDEIESTLTDAVIQDLNSRVLLPYVHVLIPQAARPDQQHRRRDLHAKFRKLKQFIKQSLQEQAAATAAASAAASASAEPLASSPKWPSVQAGQLGRHNSRGWGAPGSGDGAGGSRAGFSAPGGAAGGAADNTEGARPHQLRPNSLSGPIGWASLKRHSITAQQQAELQSMVPGISVRSGAPGQGEPAVLSATADHLKQLSSTVSSLNQQVESVATASAVAAAELTVKVDSLQSELVQMKALLVALLEKAQ